jgi:hypothetical protein
MIKLTETREITPFLWVHPDAEGCITQSGENAVASRAERR